jgi:hypothetical protein
VHDVAGTLDELIAQMVEARLLGRHVGEVGGVGAAVRHGVGSLLDDADRQSQQPIDRPHPFGVAARQVVVERQHVRATPLDRLQRDGHRGRQRLSLAGLHFDDGASVERQGRHHLHVVRTVPERPPRGIAHERVQLGAEVVAGSSAELRTQSGDTRRQCGIWQAAHLPLVPCDQIEVAIERAESQLDVRAAQTRQHVAPRDFVANPYRVHRPSPRPV